MELLVGFLERTPSKILNLLSSSWELGRFFEYAAHPGGVSLFCAFIGVF